MIYSKYYNTKKAISQFTCIPEGTNYLRLFTILGIFAYQGSFQKMMKFKETSELRPRRINNTMSSKSCRRHRSSHFLKASRLALPKAPALLSIFTILGIFTIGLALPKAPASPIVKIPLAFFQTIY